MDIHLKKVSQTIEYISRRDEIEIMPDGDHFEAGDLILYLNGTEIRRAHCWDTGSSSTLSWHRTDTSTSGYIKVYSGDILKVRSVGFGFSWAGNEGGFRIKLLSSIS